MTLESIEPLWLGSIVPLVVLWWWLKQRRSKLFPHKEVASIQLWKRLTPKESRSERWITLIPALILVLLATGPRILSTQHPDYAWTRTHSGDLRLDFLSDTDVNVIQIVTEDGTESDIPVISHQQRHTAWISELPDGAKIKLRKGAVEQYLSAPASGKPARLYYRGTSPAWNLVLDALEEEDWIERVSDEEAASAEIVIGPRGSIPPPNIAIADEGPPVWLPSLQTPHPDEPLFEGLNPGSWTVTSGYPVTEGSPLLLTESGQSLITRTVDGYIWGFDPEAGDLGKRSDWPVVMIRMLVELTSPRHEKMTRWDWTGVHFTLVASVLLILFFLLKGGRRSILCALVTVLAIFAGNRSTEIRWPDFERGSSPIKFLKSLPTGHQLTFSADDPVLSPELIDAITRRGLGWTVKESEPSPGSLPWTLSRSVIDPGETIGISGNPTVENWSLISPLGTTQQLQLPITETTPGKWTVTDSTGRKQSFLIRPPIPVVTAASPGSGLPRLFSDMRFQQQTVEEAGLPVPAPGSVFAWQGKKLPKNLLAEIPSWVESGGTLFAISGDPFCEDEETRRVLGEVLGAPLPSQDERDLDMGVILLDLSGSLIGNSATTLLESTLAIIDTPHIGLRWGVAGFRNDFEWLLQPGTRIESGTSQLLTAEIRSGGGTRLGFALKEILPPLRLHQGSKRLLVLTDGRTSPANWSTIGNEFSDAGIDLEFLLVGQTVETSAAEELVAAAAGSLQWARTPAEAIERITGWIPDDIPGWRRTRPPLIQNEKSPLISGFASNIPLPDQLLNPGRDSLAKTECTVVWSDGSGKTLLSNHPLGSGQGNTLVVQPRFTSAGSVRLPHWESAARSHRHLCGSQLPWQPGKLHDTWLWRQGNPCDGTETNRIPVVAERTGFDRSGSPSESPSDSTPGEPILCDRFSDPTGGNRLESTGGRWNCTDRVLERRDYEALVRTQGIPQTRQWGST